ncbi:hypothetical protein VYU27_005305 [Nannochloropsis oceanica]
MSTTFSTQSFLFAFGQHSPPPLEGRATIPALLLNSRNKRLQGWHVQEGRNMKTYPQCAILLSAGCSSPPPTARCNETPCAGQDNWKHPGKCRGRYPFSSPRPAGTSSSTLSTHRPRPLTVAAGKEMMLQYIHVNDSLKKRTSILISRSI